MNLRETFVDLSPRFRDGAVAQEHSGEVRPLPGEGRFALHSGAAVLRYRLDGLGLPAAQHLFFALTVSLGGEGAAPLLLSVVNGRVTDGRVWHLEPSDRQGRFTLNGLLRAEGDGLVVYANFEGVGEALFRVESLVLAALPARPLRLAFCLDPWLERGEPAWREDYTWWCANLAKALNAAGIAVESRFVLGDATTEAAERHCREIGATVVRLPQHALLDLYGSHRAGITDQRRRAQSPPHSLARRRLCAMLAEAIGEAPDIVFSISDMQILKDAAPGALVLYRDAVYCRPPFPDELSGFDIEGLYRQSALARLLAGAGEERVPAAFLRDFLPAEPEVEALLRAAGIGEEGFLLLPLQDSTHANFYDESGFHDQAELLIAAAARFPERRILVTQHPHRQELSPAAIERLRARYPNVLEIPALASLPNPSARLLPFCDGLIAVSTGVIFQALMLDKPVHLMGRHALEDLLADPSRAGGRQALAFRLLTRGFASYAHLLDGPWLAARLAALWLWRAGLIGPEALAIDLPGSVFRRLSEHRRP